MITKRDTYDEQIPMYCETCNLDFTIEGYIEYIGNGEERLIPANGEPVLCPDDKEWSRRAGTDRRIIPSHDVSYSGGGST